MIRNTAVMVSNQPQSIAKICEKACMPTEPDMNWEPRAADE